MVINTFSFSQTPVIHFGNGKFTLIGPLAQRFGQRALIITGEHSLKRSGRLDVLHEILNQHEIEFSTATVNTEPSPEQVDSIVNRYKSSNIDVVIAIGGGSVIDTGKAVSAMLVTDGPVNDYLEGIGTKSPPGNKIPFIAVPTTAGTGSETTKNAVLCHTGEHGYKKSLRHDNYIPDVALIDPELTLGLPNHITAYCGLDAFSQLLESYLSIKSSPMTDALAVNGIEHINYALPDLVTSHQENPGKRASMAYAAMLSGITLANAGLGIVHGIAGPLGGFYTIPHGLACGKLLFMGIKTTIDRMLKDETAYKTCLEKCAHIGSILSGNTEKNIQQGCNALLNILEKWSNTFDLPGLRKYGMKNHDLQKITEASSNKNNPVKLGKEDITTILSANI